jgi:integrase
VLERQLALRDRLARRGRIRHEQLFFEPNDQPIRRLHSVHRRWHRTLKRLAIRYRTPYTARHSSVSWNLMIGRNPLFVAQQHGHRILTMLMVYAAWTEGSTEADIGAIRRAMQAPAFAARSSPGITVPGYADWAINWPTASRRKNGIARTDRNLKWRSGRDSNSHAPTRESVSY